MSRTIKKAAVLGSGVMGSAVAAHLAGCGIPVLMLDIPAPDSKPGDDPKVRNKFAAGALAAALKSKPPSFYSPRFAGRVRVGNFEDDFAKIGDADWIIEVVIENLEIKKKILKQVEEHRKEGSIVSTNTSGISVEKMSEDISSEMREHFLGTHFFNPVRFMKLLEIIPHPDTKREILDFVADFCKVRLGKGVVWCKDTPNFIANRIGVYSINATMYAMMEEGLRIDEVDAIVGAPLGRPRTAAFRTSDLVGLDTMSHVAKTVYDNCPDDEEREIFKTPDFLTAMIEKKWLGDKTRGGFYKKKGKERFVLDYKTMEYVPATRPKFDSVGKAKGAGSLPQRIKALAEGDDKAARFAWKVMAKGLIYTAKRIPEISESIVEVDRALQWGFNWKLGPFRTWDALGVRHSVERMKADGLVPPQNVLDMLAKGNESFYKKENGKEYAYNLVRHIYEPVEKDPQVLILSDLGKEATVEKNDGATIWDLGDGVIGLEFHTKMNAIDNDVIAMQNRAVDLLEEGRFEALVVANNADDFSVGANLFMILMAINNNAFDQVETMVREFQKANMRMKYCSRPVVTAPAGKTLGGGFEVVLHGQKVVAAAETYAGLVEVGVGLIPAGGGTKELTMRMVEGITPGATPPLLPFAQKAFEAIAMAKVPVGMIEAQDMGLLRRTDIMVPNRDLLIHRAKEVAMGLVLEGCDPGAPREDIVVAGESAAAAFRIFVHGMLKGGWISEHDQLIASKVAYIIGGGRRAEGQTITEWELLELEIEAFMSLLGEKKTVERIQYMLMNGKPLRN